MNYLAIDYGTKRIGLAMSTMDIISTLPAIKNDSNFLQKLSKIIEENKIEKIFVGVSEGDFAEQTKSFVAKLSSVLQLPIETVEEAVSTIEATEIYLKNKKKKKNYKADIDSVAAAVILRRVL